MNVLILAKTLDRVPVVIPMANLGVDRLRNPQDVYAWLALRQRAFSDQDPPVRPWTPDDFRREFQPDRDGRQRLTWLARFADRERHQVAGAVSVSLSESPSDRANLHWLMVDPGHRRLGIGSLLLKIAERHCREQGYQGVRLETHRGWEAAVRFYTRHGYLPMRIGGSGI